MSDLEQTTKIWVLEAKVAVLSAALQSVTDGVRGIALTLREWAVAAGGHTPSAIVASKLLELINEYEDGSK